MENLDLFEQTQQSIKFQRLKNLVTDDRLYIAFTARIYPHWGTITNLAKQFGISRTFVYMLEKQLDSAVAGCFGDNSIGKTEISIQEKNGKSIEFILSLRMEGKCSIPAISSILKRMDLPFSSVGSISEILNEIGSYLPDTIQLSDDEKLLIYVYLAADELFAHSIPILISVDPISSAVVKIQLAESRETKVWIEHFNSLIDNGVNIIKVVCDEAKPITLAVEQTVKKQRQPDTFHAVSHRLGKWVHSLFSSACSKIEEEYYQEKMFESAKTEKMLQVRMDKYDIAVEQAKKAISLSDDFNFLYYCIIEQLLPFDKDGYPRNKEQAQEDIRTALDCIFSLPVSEKLKKSVNTIFNLADDLLAYLDDTKKVFKELVYQGIPEYIIKFFALAWQYEKNEIKAKHSSLQKYFSNLNNNQIELLKQILGETFTCTKTKIYAKFNTIVQSSAIVENINSIVRCYLNVSKNQINQNMLNLIMFYLNNRIYKAGKRKGYSPLELLTGTKQKDWLELLIEKYNNRKYSPVAA